MGKTPSTTYPPSTTYQPSTTYRPTSSGTNTLPHPSHQRPTHAVVPETAVTTQVQRSAPAQLELAALAISSPLGPVRGLNPDGTLDDAPLSGPIWSLPWWYDEGPTPGQSGSAVILGHVDSALGQGGLGVFFRLGDARVGEGIDVTLANGTTTHWTVTSVRLYADSDFPDSVVYARSGPPVLRLVTCGGAFDWSTHEYVSAVVVTADLVPGS